jgi:hypothetical protein
MATTIKTDPSIGDTNYQNGSGKFNFLLAPFSAFMPSALKSIVFCLRLATPTLVLDPQTRGSSLVIPS